MHAHKHIHQPDTCLRFYVRMAAIARKIYLNKNSGVGQLAKVTNSLITFPQFSCAIASNVSLSLPQQAFGSNERRGAKVTICSVQSIRHQPYLLRPFCN